ncbi:hypothetical protein ACFYTQ_24685 [Nocardia sp. NPDC004068]|uniref:hypothetical protein n=1 Tax=Nocardia sp. NPDC004068 TaxID=3364303 RepID=UPI0036AC12D8
MFFAVISRGVVAFAVLLLCAVLVMVAVVAGYPGGKYEIPAPAGIHPACYPFGDCAAKGERR